MMRIMNFHQKELMYKTAGDSVYPVRIENYLIKYSDILLIAVIGVPDKIYEMIGVVFIAPKPALS